MISAGEPEAGVLVSAAGLLPAEASLTNSEHAAAQCGQAFDDDSASPAATLCSAHASGR